MFGALHVLRCLKVTCLSCHAEHCLCVMADVSSQMDLLETGGTDLQAMYNVAVLDAVNEQIVAAQQKVSRVL